MIVPSLSINEVIYSGLTIQKCSTSQPCKFPF